MEGFWKKHLFKLCCLFAGLSSLSVSAQVKDSSFIHIYKSILSLKCAEPACHDGSFEPNFTSLASSYNTMVYHPIIKNNAGRKFEYRVLPYNAKASVLYERITNCCFINHNDRMPILASPLTEQEIADIEKWIVNGAKQPDGKQYAEPEKLPFVSPSMEVWDEKNNIISSNKNRRKNILNQPILINNITSLTLRAAIAFPGEPSTAIFFELFTNDKNIIYTSTVVELGDFWQGIIPQLNALPHNVQIYFRVKMISKKNTVTYYPDTNTETTIKQTWSFILQ